MVRVLDNRIWLNDEYVNGYRQPFVDPTQDLSLKSTSFINGALQIEFSRPVYTGDIGDWSLAGCIPWQVRESNVLVVLNDYSNRSVHIANRP